MKFKNKILISTGAFALIFPVVLFFFWLNSSSQKVPSVESILFSLSDVGKGASLSASCEAEDYIIEEIPTLSYTRQCSEILGSCNPSCGTGTRTKICDCNASTGTFEMTAPAEGRNLGSIRNLPAHDHDMSSEYCVGPACNVNASCGWINGNTCGQGFWNGQNNCDCSLILGWNTILGDPWKALCNKGTYRWGSISWWEFFICGSWSWVCDGTGTGSDSPCNMNKSLVACNAAKCGGANNGSFANVSALDTAGRCTEGNNINFVETGSGWTWTCNQNCSGVISNANCQAFNVVACLSAPGQCGVANGVIYNSVPPEGELCLAGNLDAPPSQSNGVYKWQCNGTCSGAPVSCFTKKPWKEVTP